MTKEKRNSLIKLFQDHKTQVSNLQFGNYGLAETLCQRTKMFSSRYFPNNTYYFYDLAKLDFKSSDTSRTSAREAWDVAYNRLVGISHSMFDAVQLSNTEPYIDLKKLFLAAPIFIISSLFIWTFNIWAKWTWLGNHPKQIAIYLSLQLIIFCCFALIITNNKQGRFFERLGVAISCAGLIISAVA